MRGSRASQSDTAILPSEPGSGARLWCMRHVEAGGRSSTATSSRREAEPAMRMLLAQELEIVRREVDDQQPAAAARSTRAASRIARAPSSRKCST